MARIIRVRNRLLAVLLSMLVCAPGVSAAHGQISALDTVNIAMGYIPNIQFAPFYVADARGYYKAAKIKVSFNYEQSPDIITLIATGNLAFGNVEGDQVVVGRAKGLPVTSVLTQYERFPVAIFALESKHIRSFADLKGKTIGIPGLYGSSYSGLLAALKAAGLSAHDVHIEAINYAQVVELARGQVDAAVGFAMNEPVQLQQQGYKVTVLPLATLVNLAGAGVVTSDSMVRGHADLVRRFVQATYRGLKKTNANPSTAFTLSRPYIHDLTPAQVKYQQAVLRAAIPYWLPVPGHGLGCGVAATWSTTQSVLLGQGQIRVQSPVSSFYTNRFLAGC